MPTPPPADKRPPGIVSLLRPYTGLVTLLLLMALLSNGVNLVLPKIISGGIDAFTHGNFHLRTIVIQFGLAILFVFIFTYLQSMIQTYVSEKVARDLRGRLADKISKQDFAYIENANPARLLTNLTADVDSIKLFVSQAIVSIVSSLFIIIGASILLLTIDWKLALAVIAIIPIIGITFFVVLKKVRALFRKSREVIDWLNKVISESILGAALVRVISAQQLEYDKFLQANTRARDLGLSILRLFASLIPVITFTANMAALTILALGGRFVIQGSMTLGDFAAFNSYLALLIFPILVIGFMSNVIAQATASYQRITSVLHAPEPKELGTITSTLQGDVRVAQLTITYGQKPALKEVSFHVPAGLRTAIIGPTAAGKTQLLYALTGLIRPGSGTIQYDGHAIDAYEKESFYRQVGFVFQDSILFNMSIRENIAFSDTVTNEALEKAIVTAELKDFISQLPDQLNTIVSERGTSLSGGQKQRIMLARALAVNPRVLLLDDFTARLDTTTEQKILNNIREQYPGITLISVTQKVASVAHYDQIVLLMEGEVIAKGTHKELMEASPEYVQIFNSQLSTNELQS